jgi:hypothetical protein
MAYVKTTWVNGETPINADNLNHIETGIKGNETLINNITGSILWTNQNPTADFSGQTITLSSSDYDVLEFIWRTDSVGNLSFSEKVMKGKGTQFDFFSTAIVGRRWSRRILYVSDTSYSFNDCYKLDSSATMENDNCVPLYVVGYKTNLFN